MTQEQSTPSAAPAASKEAVSLSRLSFRKKPVVIEAFRWTDGAEFPDWLGEAFGAGIAEVREPAIEAKGVVPHIVIRTLEGSMQANVGDWIIRGVKGELYPCKPDIFEATYEPAEQHRSTPSADVEKVARAIWRQVRDFNPSDPGPEWADLDDVSKQTFRAYSRAAISVLSLGGAIRAEALEEAARIADTAFADAAWHTYYRSAAGTIAVRIRSLKAAPHV